MEKSLFIPTSVHYTAQKNTKMVFFGAKDRNHSTLLLATKHTKMEFFGAKDKTREYPLSVQFSEEGIRLMHHLIG